MALSITTDNFQKALAVLNHLTTGKPTIDQSQVLQFGTEYEGQHPIMTAFNILNHAAIEGSDEQRKALSRSKIIKLNRLLQEKNFIAQVCHEAEIKMKEGEAAKFEGIQLALPPTKCTKMLKLVTLIPRIAITILIDVLLLPGALVLLIAALFKKNFDPKQAKHTTPIILIHGSGFNQVEWAVGRLFLNKTAYGSVFSFNCDGLVSNDPKKGIDDYAKEKLRAKIEEVAKATGSNRVILIGHSMGGMIAGHYAERLAEHHQTAAGDRILVPHVISIATPWRGTPMIDRFWKLGGCCSMEQETVRHRQMSVTGGTDKNPTFRKDLIEDVLRSERNGKRKYYNIYSTTDYAVPNRSGKITEDPRRQRSFSYLGHCALVIFPWRQIRSWLDEAYKSEPITGIV